MRLFAASSATETNTFLPIPIARSSFEVLFSAPGGGHPEVPKQYSAALLVTRRRVAPAGCAMIEGPTFWAEPSGTVDPASFESMWDEIFDQLERVLPLDGALMRLHGASVADGYTNAEGDLIEHVSDLNALGANHRSDNQYSPPLPVEH